MQAHGRLQRRLAHRVVVSEQPSTSGRAHGDGQFSRAHRLSPTALTLSADDTVAFTVGKDGSIFRWDIETLRKVQLYRYAPGLTPKIIYASAPTAAGTAC